MHETVQLDCPAAEKADLGSTMEYMAGRYLQSFESKLVHNVFEGHIGSYIAQRIWQKQLEGMGDFQ